MKTEISCESWPESKPAIQPSCESYAASSADGSYVGWLNGNGEEMSFVA